MDVVVSTCPQVASSSKSGVMPARRWVTLLESVAVEQRFKQRVPFLIDDNVRLKEFHKTHCVDSELEQQLEEEEEECTYSLFRVKGRGGSKPIIVSVIVHGTELAMELDKGASRSIISERTYEQIRKNGAPSLESFVIKLGTYTGEQLSVLGTLSVPVTYQDQHIKDLDLLVVKGDDPSFFGRNWLDRVRLDWSNMHKIRSQSQSRLQSILQGFQSVFGEDLGEAKNFSAKIYVAKDEKPRFYHPRRVPYSLKNKVEEELNRLENKVS